MNDLRKKFSHGLKYTFIAKYSNVIAGIVISAFLARLLTPDEFGVMAIVITFTSFMHLFSEMGLGPAVVQFRDLSDSDVSSLFLFSLLLGGVFGIGFVGLSFIMALLYEDSIYVTISPLMFFLVFFSNAIVVPSGILRREQRFKVVGITEVVSHVFAGAIAILLAYKGAGIYALLVQQIMSRLTSLIILISYSKVKLTRHFSWIPVRRVFSFSAFQFGFNTINYFARNLDKLLAGRFLGSALLGVYDRAYRLMLYPVQYLTFVITPVLHPVFSEYQNNKEVMLNAYLKLLTILALLGFPITAFLIGTGEEIILLMYGNQWMEAIPIFRILSVCIGFQILMSTSGSVYQAAGRTDLLFKAGIITTSTIVSGVLIGLNFGITGMATGVSIAMSFNFLPVFLILFRGIFRAGFRDFLSAISRPLLISLFVLGSVFLVDYFLGDLHFLASLFLKMGVSLFVFALGIKLGGFSGLLKKYLRRSK